MLYGGDMVHIALTLIAHRFHKNPAPTHSHQIQVVSHPEFQYYHLFLKCSHHKGPDRRLQAQQHQHLLYVVRRCHGYLPGNVQYLYLNTDTIRIFSLYKSETMLLYVHMIAQSFLVGLEANVVLHRDYALIPPDH